MDWKFLRKSSVTILAISILKEKMLPVCFQKNTRNKIIFLELKTNIVTIVLLGIVG